MHKEELQIENGNFTRIANAILDSLYSAPLSGSEFRIVLAVIRKTYGYQKKEDSISLSQLCEKTKISKRNVIYLLQNLEAKKILIISREKYQCNLIRFNKYFDTWVVQSYAPQVKKNRDRAKESSAKFRNGVVQSYVSSAKLGNEVVQNSVKKVNSFAHTKEIKKYTKERAKNKFLQDSQLKELIDLFKEVNPMYRDFFKNTTERKCLDEMAKQLTYEKLKSTIDYLPKIIGQPFAPKPTKPTELRRDLGKLIAFSNQQKSQTIKKTTPNYIL